jgi:hypothetical protein
MFLDWNTEEELVFVIHIVKDSMKKCHVGVFISPLKERLAATQESKDTLY